MLIPPHSQPSRQSCAARGRADKPQRGEQAGIPGRGQPQTAASKATEAALAAYPGGIVDRVVLLSNGEYEVHYIGVNWPHHIFVNQDFQVVGAD